jgi:hypothetical protein
VIWQAGADAPTVMTDPQAPESTWQIWSMPRQAVVVAFVVLACCDPVASRSMIFTPRLRRASVQRRDPPHRLLGAAVRDDSLAISPLRRVARFNQLVDAGG